MAERKIDAGMIMIAVMVVILAVVGVFVYLQVRVDAISSISDAGGNIPVLYVVRDDDSVLLSTFVILNTRTGRMASLDFPDNLGGILDALKRTDRVGALIPEKGMEAYRAYLEKLTGQSIPFWIDMQGSQFSQIVDLLGGLEMFVSDSIDTVQDGHVIRIPSGTQVLGGGKVLDYLRYVDDLTGEQDAYNRRWSVTRAFLDRMMVRAPYFRNAAFRSLFLQRVSTGMDESGMQKYASLLSGSSIDELISQRVMGSLQKVDGDKKLLFPHSEGLLLKESLRQALATLESGDVRLGSGQIRVEILNGTGQGGLANRTKDVFANLGIQVSSVGNASVENLEKTQIIDRRGDPALAREVARAIKCENIVTQVDGNEQSDVDVTVILGRDFNGWTVRN